MLSHTESQQTLNDRQLVNDPDPYSEKQDPEFSSQIDDQKKRKLDNHIFY